MSEAVKLAPNCTPGVHGKSHSRGDHGAFDRLFQAGKSDKGNPARPTQAGQPEVPAWGLRARLEAAIAAEDGARRSGETDPACQPQSDPEVAKDDRDPAETEVGQAETEVPLTAIIPIAEQQRFAEQPRFKNSAEPPSADTGQDKIVAAKQANPEAPVKTDPPAEAEVSPAKVTVTMPAAVVAAAPERQLAMPEAARTNPTQPATTKPAGEAEGEFVTFASHATAELSGGDTESEPGGSQDRRGGDGAAAAKVTVMTEQTLAAPAIGSGATASALVTGLAADTSWQNALRTVASTQHLAAQMSAAPLHTMKLQLHPAELGMVTANLRFTGDRLQVELQVENRDAYDRLSTDSDAIVKSLRALGYEIDQVSVQQPQIANNTAARTETSFGAPGGSAHDAQAFGGQGAGNGEGRLGGQGAGRGQGNAGGGGEGNAQAAQDRAQRGVYI